jgi:uncharacterized protein DUF3465
MNRSTALRFVAIAVIAAGLAYAVLRSRGAEVPQSFPVPQSSPLPQSFPPEFASDAAILRAIEQHRSNVWGVAAGTVVRVLPDDRKGNRHQRFLIRLETGATVMADYNIDLAPRIAPLEVGDSVVLRGRYVWNDQGGLMHWLHHDPSGAPGGGWVKARGRVYQ